MIYQILIDRFNGGWTVPPQNANAFLGGTLSGIQDKLDIIEDEYHPQYIWLSPFFVTNAYHGYHTLDYGQIDPHFGTWKDLENLVKAADHKAIKIIADFVPNHCHYNHPFFQDAISNPSTSKYRDWFYFKDDHSSEYLCFTHYKDLPKFNLENPETAEYFINVGEKLCKDYGIGGFRIDHALGIPMSFLQDFRQRMHQIHPDTLVMGEVWGYGVERQYYDTLHFRNKQRKRFYIRKGLYKQQESLQLDYHDTLDAVLDFEFQRLLIDEVKSGHRLKNNKRLFKGINKHFASYPSKAFQVILFLDNHDTDRFLFYCKGDTTLLDEAIEIMKDSGKQYAIYYGTKSGMCNQTTIFDAEPFADLRVREPMNWA